MTGKNNDSSSGTKLFLTNLLSQYGLQLAKYIIPLLTLPYLARVLSLDGYGIRSYVLSAMTLSISAVLRYYERKLMIGRRAVPASPSDPQM